MPYPEPKEFAQAVVAEMKAHGHAMGIYPETHARFVAELIIEREERAERRKRLEEKIAGSLVLSAILAGIGLLGAGVLAWIRSA